MHTQLEGLLAAVELGDFDAFGPLADFLEERGDPRADLAREVMKLEPHLIAQALCEIRTPQRSSDDFTTGLEATLAGGMFGLALVLLAGVAARDLTHAVAGTGIDEALKEVEAAIRTRRLSADVASAITAARIKKRDRLLDQLRIGGEEAHL